MGGAAERRTDACRRGQREETGPGRAGGRAGAEEAAEPVTAGATGSHTPHQPLVLAVKLLSDGLGALLKLTDLPVPAVVPATAPWRRRSEVFSRGEGTSFLLHQCSFLLHQCCVFFPAMRALRPGSATGRWVESQRRSGAGSRMSAPVCAHDVA